METPAKSIPWIRLVVLAIGVILFDRVTKELIATTMSVGESIPVLGNFFHITYVQNPGGAFGTRFGGTVFYIVAAMLAGVVLIFWLFQKRHMTMGLTGIALMLGGAIGNLWDRATVGVVTDFLDFGIGLTRWPFFNVADSAITIGFCLLILQEIFPGRKKPDDVLVERAGKDNGKSESEQRQDSKK